MTSGQELYRRARELIPGGTQLLSKRPEMALPEQWPAYYASASGVEVVDLTGRKFIDMSYMGIGANVLGYCDAEVDKAVLRAIQAGSMSTLNCPEEVALAELLIQLHPWADNVRYARCGGEAMAVAVRIARAASGRDKIAFCGYHGWSDWYLAANITEGNALGEHLLSGLEPAGVPRNLRNTAFPFRYNKIEELRAIVAEHGPQLGVIVMEPTRGEDPAPGFIEEIRDIATKNGCVLIFDEVSSGFRIANGGAHLGFSVQPDVAVFAKALGNGYPMSAIIGRKSVMQAAQSSFISSTYWTERIGPTAAIAMIEKFVRENVSAHLVKIGKAIQNGWLDAGIAAGLNVHVGGMAPLSHFHFEDEQAQAMRTLFTQEMLARGFLATAGFYSSYAHNDQHVSNYLSNVREVFALIAAARAENRVEALLTGPVAHSGFQRLA